MPSDAGLCGLQLTSPPCSSLSHLKNEKGSTEYDLKTWQAGNTIETTVIAILEYCLTAVDINCVLLFTLNV